MPPRVIEEDDCGRAGQAELLRGYPPFSRFHDGVSVILQRPAQGFAEARITIQQKYLRHRCAACLPRGGWRAAGAGVLEGGGLCYQSAPLLRAAIISPAPRMRGGVRVRWNWHLVLTSSPSQRDISETVLGYQEHYTISWRPPVFRACSAEQGLRAAVHDECSPHLRGHDPPDGVPPCSPGLNIQTVSACSLAHDGGAVLPGAEPTRVPGFERGRRIGPPHQSDHRGEACCLSWRHARRAGSRSPCGFAPSPACFVFAANTCPTRVAKGISSAAYRSLASGLALSFRISTIVVA